jgi:peptidoglycan-associated lipoprotein
MYNHAHTASEYLTPKGVLMSNFLFKSFAVFALSIMLISGCAKDQVKPDEGLATPAPGSQSADIQASGQKSSADQAAADRAAAERAAAERAAAEKAAAERAAAEKAAAERAAAERAAAEKAAAERAAAERAAADKAAESALKMITFDFDSYVLSKPARDILYNNADYLLKKYKGKVKLEGHCDERGSDEYNLALGEKRAKAAMDYLSTLGVPSEQLSIISYGKERPLDAGHTEESWARNRRVEFVLVK